MKSGDKITIDGEQFVLSRPVVDGETLPVCKEPIRNPRQNKWLATKAADPGQTLHLVCLDGFNP